MPPIRLRWNEAGIRSARVDQPAHAGPKVHHLPRAHTGRGQSLDRSSRHRTQILACVFITRVGIRQPHCTVLLAFPVMGQAFVEGIFETASPRQITIAIFQKEVLEPAVENKLDSQHETKYRGILADTEKLLTKPCAQGRDTF